MKTFPRRIDGSNGNISSLSDHDLHCCERQFKWKMYPGEELIFCSYFLLSLAKNILKDLSHNYDSCQQRIQLSSSLHRKRFFAASGFLVFWEILRLKVESRILRLMLKTFPISQICDGDSPSTALYFSSCFNIIIDNFLFIFSFFLAQTFCKKPHLACVGCKSCNISFHQHWSQVTYLKENFKRVGCSR